MSERKLLLQEMIAEDGRDPFLHYALALEYLKEGKVSQVLEILEGLSTRHPDYLATYYQWGKCLEATGALDHAETAYRKGMEVAQRQGERKTLGELNEALMLLEDLREDQGES